MPTPRTKAAKRAVIQSTPKMPGESNKDAPRRAGPYRNTAVHESIVKAAWELLEELGYVNLTIEGVAQRAGVGKATIYRWWSSKGALVAEAISTHLEHGQAPLTGDVRRDLQASIQITVDNYSGTVAGVAIPALLADLAFDPESYEAFRRSFLAPRREGSAEIVRRAIAEGLLPDDTDVGLLLDVWAGAIFYRVLISREPIEATLAESLTALILGDPPKTRTKRRPK